MPRWRLSVDGERVPTQWEVLGKAMVMGDLQEMLRRPGIEEVVHSSPREWARYAGLMRQAFGFSIEPLSNA